MIALTGCGNSALFERAMQVVRFLGCLWIDPDRVTRDTETPGRRRPQTTDRPNESHSPLGLAALSECRSCRFG
jgi:hypothetical protein